MNRVLLAILFLFLPVSCVADGLFDIKPVADGIYAAIAKPAYKVNCNAIAKLRKPTLPLLCQNCVETLVARSLLCQNFWHLVGTAID